MNETQIDTLKWAKQGLATLTRQLDLVFENAPVMMHSIDHEGKLIKVNRAWLQAMGYERDEVLGRKSIDFLTEASRRRAIEETIPLFWKAGEAHSIGYEMVRKDGQCLDLLLDAHLCTHPTREPVSIAALSAAHDPQQWLEASTTLKTLQRLSRLAHALENALSEQADKQSDPPQIKQSPDPVAAGALLAVWQDISASLRVLTQANEERLDELADAHRELGAVAKSIDRTLRDLGDDAAGRRT